MQWLTGKKLFILSDRYLVGRICENLLSNAIKYTPQGKNVWMSIHDEHDHIGIKGAGWGRCRHR